MAFTTISVAYDGVNKRDWYTTLFNQIDVLPYFQVVPGNKLSAKIPNMTFSNLLKSDSCEYSSGSGLTISEKTISVCKLDIHQTICIDELEQTFIGEYMKGGALNSDIPTVEFNFINDKVKESVQNSLEEILWLGNTASGSAPTNLCDGLRKKLVNTAYSASTVNLTAATVSASNVFGEMAKLKAAAPAEMKSKKAKKDLFYMVSPEIFDFFETALANQNASLLQNSLGLDTQLNYIGIPVIMVPSMATNEMVLTIKDNFVWSTDLMSDYEALRILDQRNGVGSNSFHLVGRMFFGVEVKFPQYVVIYK